MIACLVGRNYVTLADENSYAITTNLFELAHVNPPTHRLLFEATPIMQRLAGELDQSCHLTIYGQGKQVVLCKVETPSGMGFAVRAGAELDVLISASGRVLFAFQDDDPGPRHRRAHGPVRRAHRPGATEVDPGGDRRAAWGRSACADPESGNSWFAPVDHRV